MEIASFKVNQSELHVPKVLRRQVELIKNVIVFSTANDSHEAKKMFLVIYISHIPVAAI